jgi:hypothetical protein
MDGLTAMLMIRKMERKRVLIISKPVSCALLFQALWRWTEEWNG